MNTQKRRTLERKVEVPFTQKYARQINAVWTLITLLAIAFISFDIGFILGGA